MHSQQLAMGGIAPQASALAPPALLCVGAASQFPGLRCYTASSSSQWRQPPGLSVRSRFTHILTRSWLKLACAACRVAFDCTSYCTSGLSVALLGWVV
uniref:Uncharacterized protein n=1 Tax=Physcomitrium patens TaxID=3218 RepID=A0A2K1IRS3_PHYPA|nr:hypothetical protein PHYPA_026099 [Physcomitrium patens]